MPRSARRQPGVKTVTGSAASLSRFTSTNLVVDIGAVTRVVMKRGAAIITRHDAPVMVLVSMDRYAEMENASTPDLGALTVRFDAAYARMQAPGVAQRTIAALDLDANTATHQGTVSSRRDRADQARTGTAKPVKAPVRRRA